MTGKEGSGWGKVNLQGGRCRSDSVLVIWPLRCGGSPHLQCVLIPVVWIPAPWPGLGSQGFNSWLLQKMQASSSTPAHAGPHLWGEGLPDFLGFSMESGTSWHKARKRSVMATLRKWDADMEKRPVDTAGVGEGGMNYESSIETCTFPQVK